MSSLIKSLAFLPIALSLAYTVAAADCSPLELIMARGTTEPAAPEYGVIVGDPMYEAVKALLPETTGYKVNYPASFATNSKTLGIEDVVKHLNEQSKKCPKQKFSLIGYSQGADVMHGASIQLSDSIYPSIVAIVLFGDPGNRGPDAKSPLGGKVPVIPAKLATKLKQNCAKGDPVCTNSGTVVGDHLVYVDPEKGYIKSSAEYIVQQFKTDGKVGPQPSQWGGVNDKGDNSAAMLELGTMLGAKREELAKLSGTASTAKQNFVSTML